MTKPLVEQLKTRISDIKVVKDLVIVASHAGEVTVWSIVDRNRKVPRQVHSSPLPPLFQN